MALFTPARLAISSTRAPAKPLSAKISVAASMMRWIDSSRFSCNVFFFISLPDSDGVYEIAM